VYLFKKYVSWPFLFETKNVKFVSFQKKNHFLKRYKLCVVALPSKRFFFVNHFLKRYQVSLFLSGAENCPFSWKRDEKGWIQGIQGYDVREDFAITKEFLQHSFPALY